MHPAASDPLKRIRPDRRERDTGNRQRETQGKKGLRVVRQGVSIN